MNKYLIVVAGGSGKRMGAELPKQFLELAGKPVLMHTILNFYAFDNSLKIILVLPENQIDYWQQLIIHHKFSITHQIVAGGTERYYSVKNGLKLVEPDSIVAIHDGVRPFVSHQTITNCFKTASENGNAVPVIPVSDSVRKIEIASSRIVDRSKLRLVQTPQVFNSSNIKQAYENKFSLEFTDDASVLEKEGFIINLVEGNQENIKITTPFDLILGEALLEEK